MTKFVKREDLDSMNDFVFGKIMSEKTVCKYFLELLPGFEISDLIYLEPQKTLDEQINFKGVRLDIYIKDNKNKIYNVEVQTANTGNLEKKSRYYQSIIDVNSLSKGESYYKLSDTYIIFICNFDLFGKHRCIYTFNYFCSKDKSLQPKDGSTKLFINIRESEKCKNPVLRELLAYMNNRNSILHTDYVKLIDNNLKKLLSDTDRKEEYMALSLKQMAEVQEARADSFLSKSVSSLDTKKEN